MKISEMFKLLQDIRLLSKTWSPGAILEYYHNDTIVRDIIRELQDLCKTMRPYIMSLNIRKGFSEHVALAQAEKAIHKATE